MATGWASAFRPALILCGCGLDTFRLALRVSQVEAWATGTVCSARRTGGSAQACKTAGLAPQINAVGLTLLKFSLACTCWRSSAACRCQCKRDSHFVHLAASWASTPDLLHRKQHVIAVNVQVQVAMRRKWLQHWLKLQLVHTAVVQLFMAL